MPALGNLRADRASFAEFAHAAMLHNDTATPAEPATGATYPRRGRSIDGIYVDYNGEPGGARTRDHRIKSAGERCVSVAMLRILRTANCPD
jgi:hypothetical protein